MQEKESTYYDDLRKNEWKNIQECGPSALSRDRIILNLMSKYDFQGPLLDAGCGTGDFMVRISEKFPTIQSEGSEYSQEALKIAKAKGLNAFFADLTRLVDFPRRGYQSIICAEVLEHIQDDRLALDVLNKLLVKHGRMIVSVPSGMRYWSKHDEFAGHVRRYELDDMIEKLEDTGFQIIKIYIWGALIYAPYYRFITSRDPRKVMNLEGASSFLKKIIAKILYYTFFLDDLLISTGKGRRIFAVVEKVSEPD